MPLSCSPKLECTKGLDSVFALFDVSSNDFLASFVILVRSTPVEGGFDALHSLRSRVLLPSNDFFALLVITSVGVVNLSVLAHFFGGEVTHRSSRLLVSTSSAELLSLVYRQPPFAESSSRHFCPAHLDWRRVLR